MMKLIKKKRGGKKGAATVVQDAVKQETDIKMEMDDSPMLDVSDETVDAIEETAKVKGETKDWRYFKNNNKTKKEARGVVMVKNIPHGFYDKQLEGYFGQFGKVTGVYVPKSHQTGKSKGFAFVEFMYPEVAQVAAETMNNYLMFNRLIKTDLVPEEKQRPYMFQQKYKMMKHQWSEDKAKQAVKLRQKVLGKKMGDGLIKRAQGEISRVHDKLTNLCLNYKVKVAGLHEPVTLTSVKSIDPEEEKSDVSERPASDSPQPKKRKKENKSDVEVSVTEDTSVETSSLSASAKRKRRRHKVKTGKNNEEKGDESEVGTSQTEEDTAVQQVAQSSSPKKKGKKKTGREESTSVETSNLVEEQDDQQSSQGEQQSKKKRKRKKKGVKIAPTTAEEAESDTVQEQNAQQSKKKKKNKKGVKMMAVSDETSQVVAGKGKTKVLDKETKSKTITFEFGLSVNRKSKKGQKPPAETIVQIPAAGGKKRKNKGAGVKSKLETTV